MSAVRLLGLSVAAIFAAVALMTVAFPDFGRPPAEPPAPATPTSDVRYVPMVFLDQVTGCQYLSTHTSDALVPRIAADGRTHMGCSQGGRP